MNDGRIISNLMQKVHFAFCWMDIDIYIFRLNIERKIRKAMCMSWKISCIYRIKGLADVVRIYSTAVDEKKKRRLFNTVVGICYESFNRTSKVLVISLNLEGNTVSLSKGSSKCKLSSQSFLSFCQEKWQNYTLSSKVGNHKPQ